MGGVWWEMAYGGKKQALLAMLGRDIGPLGIHGTLMEACNPPVFGRHRSGLSPAWRGPCARSGHPPVSALLTCGG